MDPSTTLVTFMLQTHPSVKSVYLFGSWDNFSQYYTMERDSRRDRGQWRGCHTFKDITCDGDSSNGTKRSGGLKMGQTYYYYYELNGAVETHDPTLPSTSQCPYLPGQTVNTLFVPVEQQTLRKRSASLNSMRISDYKTMRPDDKFVTPRPPPPIPGGGPAFSPMPVRAGTAPVPSPRGLAPSSSSSYSSASSHKRSARSLSPSPPLHFNWAARRLFGLSRRDAERGRLYQSGAAAIPGGDDFSGYYRSTTPSDAGGSSRSRDISPESLRRFLSDDTPLGTPSFSLHSTPEEELPGFDIPEQIAEEEDYDDDDDPMVEDDANFATSAVSEHAPFQTLLSPSPFQRGLAAAGASTSTVVAAAGAGSTPTIMEEPTAMEAAAALPQPAALESSGGVDEGDLHPASRFSMSSASGASFASVSLASPDPTSFFDDSNDDDDDDLFSQPADDEEEGRDDEPFVFQPLGDVGIETGSFSLGLGGSFSGYTLPSGEDVAGGGVVQAPPQKGAAPAASEAQPLGSPALVARSNENGIPTGNTSLLAAPADSGLDDLVQELGWMVDVISGKQ